VLVYAIGPLAQDLEVTGPVSAILFVKSSAVDTDFTGKLIDVAPDGFAQNVAEGILRMRYRDSQEHASLLNPNQTYQISLDLWSTSNVFLRGHSLRLEIASSNFPRFDRNLNTGEELKFARRFVSATNTVLHDAQHPSALVLPVIPYGNDYNEGCRRQFYCVWMGKVPSSKRLLENVSRNSARGRQGPSRPFPAMPRKRKR